ncbi:MAG: serine/threonine-protein kinase [Kofleriaceae bacterium]
MQAAESSTLIGLSLEGRYQILREIGRGGMGVVYEADHLDLGKRVAVKVMLEKYANDTEAIARFTREAIAASRIGNPHIIDVTHIGAAPDGRPFVVMELLDGEPLSNILLATGPMAPWRAIHIMRQVLRAVGAAHAKGIIHRDLKPDNIFIVNRDDEHDFVKLLDFGISKMIDTAEQIAATRLTVTGMVMGTPLYMAPEQAAGQAAERGVDIYACGVILFEMLSGRPPFNETNYNLLVAKLLTAQPPQLGDLRPSLPPKLCAVVMQALEKDPDARWPSAESFAGALPFEREISEPNMEIATTLPPASSSMPVAVGGLATTQPPRRASARTIGLVLAVLGAGAIGAAIYINVAKDKRTVETTPPVDTHAQPETPPKPIAPPPEPVKSPVTTGKLQVETTPSAATISVDGTERGTTPIEIEVDAGRHYLHIQLAGYQPLDTEPLIHAGERTSALITLVKVDTKSKVKPTISTTSSKLTPKPGGGSATVAPPPQQTTEPENPYPNDTHDVPPQQTTTTPKKPPHVGSGESMPNPY